MFVGPGFALTALRALEEERRGEGIGNVTLALLCGVGLVYAFIHFYMFLAVGGACCALLVGSRRWSDRLKIVAAGLLVFVAMCVFLSVLLSHTQTDIQNTWFDNSADSSPRRRKRGLASLVTKWPTRVLLALVALAFALRFLKPGNRPVAIALERFLLPPSWRYSWWRSGSPRRS